MPVQKSLKYRVILSNKAIKALEKLPRSYQIRIKETVQKLYFDPFVLDIKKMNSSKATHRIRVGDYRLFLQINTITKEIILAIIKRRTTQTYR